MPEKFKRFIVSSDTFDIFNRNFGIPIKQGTIISSNMSKKLLGCFYQKLYIYFIFTTLFEISFGQSACLNTTLDVELKFSQDMPVISQVYKSFLPFEIFWNFFSQPNYWPYWNGYWTTVSNTQFVLCKPFNHGPLIPELGFNITNWYFVSILTITFHRPKNLVISPTLLVYLYKDVQVGLVSWIYLFTNGDTQELLVYGRHDNYLKQDTDNSTTFGSWEKAFGPYVNMYTNQWVHNLAGALEISLNGVKCLEGVFSQNNELSPDAVKAACAK